MQSNAIIGFFGSRNKRGVAHVVCACMALVLLYGCKTNQPSVKQMGPREKQLFVVIDDAGLVLEETRQFLDIPVPMTIAVLPHQQNTTEVCREIAKDPLKEIILHQPMEALDRSKNPGKGAIRTTTTPQQAVALLDWNLQSVPGAVGMNNHMGSGVTEDPLLMQTVLRYCRARGLFFLDSKTAYNSVVPRIAEQEQIHIEQRDSFLDIQHDREYIRRMWEQAVETAREKGYAVIIGHAWSEETALAIRDSYENLLSQGYTFHNLSELYE